jgi:hypothetical protein
VLIFFRNIEKKQKMLKKSLPMPRPVFSVKNCSGQAGAKSEGILVFLFIGQHGWMCEACVRVFREICGNHTEMKNTGEI